MLKNFFLLLFTFDVLADYEAQNLKQQVQSVDSVLHVQIVAGEIHQYERVLLDQQKRMHRRLNSCGFSYAARVIESFKAEDKTKQLIEFSTRESFAVGSHQLVFLSDQINAIETDNQVIYEGEEKAGYLRCQKPMPALYSHHLSTAEIVNHLTWVNLDSFIEIPDHIYVSPEMVFKPNVAIKEDLDVPRIYRYYGKYAKWSEFKKYLKETIEPQVPQKSTLIEKISEHLRKVRGIP